MIRIDRSGGVIRLARLVIALLLVVLTLPAIAIAQESPIGETEFTSPKYKTQIEWTDDWQVDRENSSIEVRRDVLGLISANGDDAVLIEMQSQRSFRTGEEYIQAALQTYSRLPEYTVIEDATDQSPPSLVFTFQLSGTDIEAAGYVQSQPIAGATMVVVVLGLLDDLEAVKTRANDDITVNDVPLLVPLPICGEEETGSSGGSTTSKPGDKTEASSSSNKTDKTDTDTTDASPAATCVEVFQSSGNEPRPTPTPVPQDSRGDSFDQRNWDSTQFPGAGFRYDRSDWRVESELAAEDNFGRDGIILFHNDLSAYVVVEVFDGFNGRAGACIDVALSEASISPGSDELLTDADGKPISGSTQGRVWAAYAYTLELEDEDPTEVGGYVECRALPGAKGVLVFSMIAVIDSFDDAYEAIQPMIGSIRLG